ncbi:MAG: hypothetical protein ACD_20C00085G0001 [uncultured bacterium]|nr:MAG: hypothetical protein ACD_20C00085G0001 [uncultured bacterium]
MEPNLRPNYPIATMPQAPMHPMQQQMQYAPMPYTPMHQPQMMPAPPMQQQQMSSLPPQTSAVSINIIGPQAYSGAQAQNPGSMYNYPSAPLYNYNQSPYYNMPQSSVYTPQQPYPTPPIQPQMQQQPMQYVNQYNQAPMMDPQQQPQQQIQQPEPQKAPEQQLPQVDVQALNTALKSPNLDEQFMAIQKIAEVGQVNKEGSANLLNEQTFRSLADVITADSSKLKGQEKEKADLNKMTGMWTLAVLQKNFREAMDNETKAQGLPSLSINEVPGIVPIVDNIKSDPNPAIREAGISALNYIAKPEDVQVLSAIYTAAAKDKTPSVKAAAQQALKNLQGA